MIPAFTVPEYITAITAVFRAAGLPLYVVGGAMRDFLLGLPVKEYDLCGPALPDETERLMLAAGFSYKERSRTFGTIVLCAYGGGAEYTTLRDDVYTRGHRPDYVRFTTDIKADALRRDFTINAVYFDLMNSTFVDPLNGMADIERRVIRAAAPDPHKTIGEDGLRILRMLRFAATKKMRVDNALMEAAGQHVNLLYDISPERKWAELDMIFSADWGGADVPSSPLSAMTALGVTEALFGPHTDTELAAAAPVSRTTRFAALLYKTDVKAALNALRAPLRVVERAERTARLFRYAMSGGAPDIAQCAGMDRLQVYEACATLGGEWQAYIGGYGGLLPPLTLKELDIDGRIIMETAHIRGEAVGRMLTRLHMHTLKYPQDNEETRLRALCLSFMEEEGDCEREAHDSDNHAL